jgi:D-glycero-alpha-D-manno-heptose-7-phosphate kinase
VVDAGAAILTGAGDIAEFGELLHQSWVAKRSLESSLSNSYIDDMYRTGLEAGAIGGKLLGAGGGGFLLFFARPEKHSRLRSAFADSPVVDVKVDAPGSTIIFAA